jgi:anti-sigma regulatory factor (Ser/Thr protein kinase)
MGAVHSTGPPDSRGAYTRSLTIASRLEELAAVHDLIEKICRQFSLDEETENAILIAVIEAGTNAIQHGNAFASDKSVDFVFAVNPSEITIQVDDYGKGFDPARIGNPTDPSELLNPHGRGLYLMRTLMDDVSFGTRPDHGTTVRMRKTRAGAGSPPA